MSMKLYVGNLAVETTDAKLNEMFAVHGAVKSTQILLDRESGQPKGSGFVEMTDPLEGKAALAAMNGREVAGKNLTVNEARPHVPGSGPRRSFESSSGGRSGGNRRY